MTSSGAAPTSRTVRVTGVPITANDAALESCLSSFGALKRCFVVRKRRDQDSKTTLGYAEFALREDAERCVEETGGRVSLGEAEARVERVPDKDSGRAKGKEEEEGGGGGERPDYQEMRDRRKAGRAKKGRLIVRNLSFKATEEELKRHFEGANGGKKKGEGPTVTDVHILKRPDGRRVGCAFVQMGDPAEAAEAIRRTNGSDLGGRRIAVDWAVGKKEYQGSQEQQQNSVKKDTKEEPEEEEEEAVEVKPEVKEEEKSESEDDEDDEDDVEDETDEEDDEGPPSPKKRREDWPETGHDVGENKTVFVRNMSFDSSEESLRDLCSRRFGRALFARAVVDRETGHPRGTAFVKFSEADSATAMVAASDGRRRKGEDEGEGEEEQEEEGIWLDGRRIYAVMALPKSEADLAAKRKKEKDSKDSRNLHLAVEGLVRRGTQAAVGVSDQDMQKRVSLERWKRGMLKDLNMFVSPYRLCVRNLPPQFADKDLKKLAASNCERTAKITEAKVILGTGAAAAAEKAKGKKKEGGGGAKDENRGYGFVAFAKHEDALKVLRALNNNPSVFGKASRPIVEFSVENRKALNARQKRLQKSRENNPNFKGKGSGHQTQGGGEGVQQKQVPFRRKSEKSPLSAEEKKDFMGAVNNPKNRKMPSHIGEKVRHHRISRRDLKREEKLRKMPKKKREKKIRTMAEEKRSPAQAAQQANEGGSAEKKKGKGNKNKKKLKPSAAKDLREDKRFSAMVNKYKSRLESAATAISGGAAAANKKRTKWFDD